MTTTKIQTTVCNGSIVGFSSNAPLTVEFGFSQNQLGFRHYANVVKPRVCKKFKSAAAKERFVKKLLELIGAAGIEDLNKERFGFSEAGFPVRLATVAPLHPETWTNRGYLTQPDDLVAVSSIEGGAWIQVEDEIGIDWVKTLTEHDRVARVKNTRIGHMSLKIALADGQEFNLDLGNSNDAVDQLQHITSTLAKLYGYDGKNGDLLRARRGRSGEVELGNLYQSEEWLSLNKPACTTEG